MLRPMPRCMDAPQPHAADVDLAAVLERNVRVVDGCCGVDVDRQAVVEREAAVTGDVIRVRVGLEDADEPDAAPVGLREERLDGVGGIDGDGDAFVLVPYQVGRAAEVVVHELREDHVSERSTRCRYLS